MQTASSADQFEGHFLVRRKIARSPVDLRYQVPVAIDRHPRQERPLGNAGDLSRRPPACLFGLGYERREPRTFGPSRGKEARFPPGIVDRDRPANALGTHVLQRNHADHTSLIIQDGSSAVAGIDPGVELDEGHT